MSPPSAPAYFRRRASSFLLSMAVSLAERFLRFRAPLPALANERDQRRHERNEDDADHDPHQVVLHPRDVAEEETGIGKRAHPRRGTEAVVSEKLAVGHLAHSGEERWEGAHDRTE